MRQGSKIPIYMVTLDDFKKIELKVGRVVSAEKIDGSVKLLKLQVDFGKEQRQILSGIGQYYTPESLIGRQIVAITNLEPRSMMGLESQGMLLAANGDRPYILAPDGDVPPGSPIT